MYRICENYIEIDNVQYRTYGISYGDEEITDITVDKKKIEGLVEVINRLEVSPIHIKDVVEDFI